MFAVKKIAVAVIAGLFTLSANAAVKIGDAAPNFSLSGDDGKTHALADYKGKIVVLEWTNAGCPFVKKQYSGGTMQGLQKTYTAKDVVWLSIISSAPGKQGHVDAKGAAELSASRGAKPTHVLLDPTGDTGRLYEAQTTPHMFIVDKAGKLAYAGGIDSIASTDAADVAKATPYVKNALDELLANKPVTTALAKPYGCPIKY